jgi:hypothetical protein
VPGICAVHKIDLRGSRRCQQIKFKHSARSWEKLKKSTIKQNVNNHK